MKKYKTSKWRGLIESVECDRESEFYVWIKGDRKLKESENNCYFDTYEDAKKHLLNVAQRKRDAAWYALAQANEFAKKVESLEDIR